METAIVIAVIGALQAVTLAVVKGMFDKGERSHKKEQEKLERRADVRAKEGLLSMKLVNANIDLAVATALAVKNNHCNGEMEAALAASKSAQREYYDFINRIANEQIKQ